MKKILSTLLVTAILVLAPHPAMAKSHPTKTHHNHSVRATSCTETTQTRDVTGMTAAPTQYGAPYTYNHHTYRKVTTYTWSGTQTRTMTDCDGTITYSSWTGGTIITQTTTQQLS